VRVQAEPPAGPAAVDAAVAADCPRTVGTAGADRSAAAAADHAEVHRGSRTAGHEAEDRRAERRPGAAVVRHRRGHGRGPLSRAENRGRIDRAVVSRRSGTADDTPNGWLI